MKELFDKVSIKCSRITTRAYSTSFSLGILCLRKELRDPIYAIYGFVRFADEIVDTFHEYNKTELLENFKKETWKAIEQRISLNPILNSFQKTVHQYKIDRSSIELFLRSMEMDLYRNRHDQHSLKEYILGSAEVVGLMCLRVFVNGDDVLYEQLKPYAMKLGSAFQKVNFLRDLQADYLHMGRTYFPEVDFSRFDDSHKRLIEKSIEQDFDAAYQGIKMLPRSSRFGVYVAYVYYRALLQKIRNTPSELILSTRIRIRNRHKARLLALSFVKHQLNLI
ncbi:MAG: phytoene/squalene synthase family protein [Cyclobacteriaceae bacterium]|nr:phytoene/squalene synthase family protein [Cyclobacteriaceae bacterium]MDW8332236.1 phytoene/squalene synthase family protein [Cyclobacteriaceae bacterium]